MNSRSTHLLRTLLVLFLGLLTSRSSFGLATYFEFGGGIAKVSNTAMIFPSLSSNYSATSVPLTFGVQLQDRVSGPLFSLALQERYITGGNQTLMTVAPTFRIEFWRLVVGIGYADWVYRGLASSKSVGTTALIYEGQFLFPITPEIDFGLSYAMQNFSSSSSTSTKTRSTDYGAFFRLNFGYSSQQSESRHKFKGWRYPFGNPNH